MVKILVSFLVVILASVPSFSYEIRNYPHEGKFDSVFAEIDDVEAVTNALDNSDAEMVFGALKRVGMMKIVSAKPRVIGIIASANPSANLGRAQVTADSRHLFNMGVLVLGKIGSDADTGMLASFLRDTKDPISIVCILAALGDIVPSKKGLDSLNEYTTTVSTKTDSRVVRQLVDSIVRHNSRSSINALLLMQGRVSQNQKSVISAAVKELNAKARSVPSSSAPAR